MPQTRHLSTGIPNLDDVLGGGWPAGAIVCLTAPAGTQSEIILQAFVSEHPTCYISTARSERAVHDEIEHSPYTAVDPFVVHTAMNTPIVDAEETVEEVIGTTESVIIDPVDIIESVDTIARYLTFLNKLKTAVEETGGVAILRCYKCNPADREARSYTTGVADVVIEYTRERGGETVNGYLDVPKNRFGEAIDERMKVRLTDAVKIDTTRNIA